jgi:hypothetical protein
MHANILPFRDSCTAFTLPAIGCVLLFVYFFILPFRDSCTAFTLPAIGCVLIFLQFYFAVP